MAEEKLDQAAGAEQGPTVEEIAQAAMPGAAEGTASAQAGQAASKGDAEADSEPAGEKANTVVFTSADGYVQEFPLDLLIEKGAIIASHVNGEDIKDVMGAANQLWIPGFPAKYFVRDIVKIEFENRAVVPTIPPFEDDGHDYTNRPNVGIDLEFTYPFGQPVTFRGWAHDYDKAITAVEFSLDEGRSWTSCPTEGATAERWVRWEFVWDPPEPGAYVMRVRSVNEDGKKSPIPAVSEFTVE